MKPLWKFAKNHAWHLVLFVLVMAGITVSNVFLGLPSAAWEVAFNLVVIIIAFIWGACLWHNYLTESGALKREATMAKWHYPEIAEKSNPPTMKNGEPIKDMVKWFAAVHECSREFAADVIKMHKKPWEIEDAFHAYLRGFKTV